MANLAGKRYVCTVCGSEFIVTKTGDGQLSCHGNPLEIKGAGPRPVEDQRMSGRVEPATPAEAKG
ncbi:MAG: hypothetical protein ACSLFN_08050 [Candidatus Limnocylindrales bacterium]